MIVRILAEGTPTPCSKDALRTYETDGTPSIAILRPVTTDDVVSADLPQPVMVFDCARGVRWQAYANIREALSVTVSPVVYVHSAFCHDTIECVASMVPPLVEELWIEVTGTASQAYTQGWIEEGLNKMERLPTNESFHRYKRVHDEQQYLKLVRRIMVCGERRRDRTGTGTFSVWGAQLRFSLFNNTLPLLTTKRTFWKGVREELLWFIEGCTDAKVLSERGVRIWDANGSREFLDQRGLTEYDEGCLGPVYGSQWRNFNAPYCGKRDNDGKLPVPGGGVDQLQQCIDQLKKTPHTRRCIMSVWNPQQLDQMALPPCHVLCQFSVRHGRYLVAQLYQRSADVGLGLPFNIASYSLLCHFIAHVTGYEAAELIVTLGDAHLYSDHIAPLKEAGVLDRIPYEFPKVYIRDGGHKRIDDIQSDDISLIGYKCHPAIKLPFSK